MVRYGFNSERHATATPAQAQPIKTDLDMKIYEMTPGRRTGPM
jgi:hypothetical protein